MTKPGDSQTKKTIHELVKEFPDKSYRQLEIYRDADRKEEAQRIITQQDNEELTESQRRQEELEPIEREDWKDKCEQLQKELDRVKKENNDLYNRIADLTESLKSKDYFEKPDYKFLVNENHRLEQQYLEVLADNKKLAHEIEDRVNRMRKAGM